jgi:hypothetical protein
MLQWKDVRFLFPPKTSLLIDFRGWVSLYDFTFVMVGSISYMRSVGQEATFAERMSAFPTVTINRSAARVQLYLEQRAP